MPSITDLKWFFDMEKRTIPFSLDLNRYQDVVKRINKDELADRAEGRTTAIAALILEGGLTFQTHEIYNVAVFVCNYHEFQRYCSVFAELRRESEPFKESYSGGIELQRENFTIVISDWNGDTRIKVKFLVVPFLLETHLRGIRFHNYFVDISHDDTHLSRLFEFIPLMQNHLCDLSAGNNTLNKQIHL